MKGSVILKKWNLTECSKSDIGNKFGISDIFERVILNRNIKSEYEMAVYLNPNIKYFKDTMKFKDIRKAFKILNQAVIDKKKIIIYGDYDVDGVTSTVILYKGLKNLGAYVDYYIPDREKEGYGLNMKAAEKLKKMNGELIFTCDNGIAAFEEVMFIKNLGMDIIILDHHEPQFVIDPKTGIKRDVLPKADAIIDAKQSGCGYPFKSLCAGGMSYKFIKEFYKFINVTLKNEAELFVFAAIATVCDIVDLCDENRILVRNGLKLINHRKNLNLGLSELIKVRNLEDKKITETSIGFIIGPCINASGRLESALEAVKLFITEDKDEAESLAKKMSETNEKRKVLTSDAVERLIDKIENSDIKNDKVIVIFDENIHESIAGIAAGRIKDKYYKPAIVLTNSNGETAKGSARSICSYNIFEELFKARNLFERFGGHSMAAGLSLKKENIDKLRIELNKNCNLSEADMQPVLNIDMELDFKNINLELAEELDLIRPVGKENPQPLFICRNVRIKRVNFVGANKDIIQMNVEDSFGYELKAVDFNNYDYFIKEIKSILSKNQYDMLIKGIKKETDFLVDFVYEININDYNNIRSVQLMAVDYEFLA